MNIKYENNGNNNDFSVYSGKVVSGYRVRNYGNSQKWDLLGKRDPLTPQMFYPIEKNVTVESGDILVSINLEINNTRYYFYKPQFLIVRVMYHGTT